MDTARWTAVKENSRKSDGTFYYGVKTTGIFCLPSCKSKLPLRKNIIFFDSYDQAVNSGFRPCKRCRPDLYGTYAPNEALLSDIKAYIDGNSTDAQCLESLDRRFNMSSCHITRIFKARFGVTPVEYLRFKRLEAAEKLLDTTDMKALDIAYTIGFSSYSAFFSNFKRAFGITPEAYRKGEKT